MQVNQLRVSQLRLVYVFDPRMSAGYVCRVPEILAWVLCRFRPDLDYWITPEGM